MQIKIGKKHINNKSKTYFIADIGANHDGSLKRAKRLIKLAATAGADAAKFQHFKAETIVSDHGFRKLKRLGNTVDWDKYRFTLDDGCNEAVIKAFVELHRKNNKS